MTNHQAVEQSRKPGLHHHLHRHLRHRHEKHYKESHFHLWADIFLASMVIVLAVIVWRVMFWQPSPNFFIEIKAESSRIISGQVENFVINYRNEENHTVEAAEITVILPDNFSLTGVYPLAQYNKELQTFSLGDLGGGQSGRVVVSGLVLGSLNDQQTMAARLSYRDGKETDGALASYSYFLEESVIKLEMDIPDGATAGMPLDGTLKISNAGKASLEGVQITFPELNWEISGLSHEMKNNSLTFPIIEAGASEVLEFSALATLEESLALTVQADLKKEDKLFSQNLISKIIEVGKPLLEVSLSPREAVLNGSQPVMTLDINLKNSGEADLTFLEIQPVSRRSSLRLSGVRSLSSALTARGDSLISEEILPPNASSTLSFSVSFERSSLEVEEYAVVAVKLSYKTASGEEGSYWLAVPRRDLGSSLRLESGGYYYGPQGDQLGIGPIPPKVDIPTTYWIIWQIHNLGNDIDQVEVSGDLPGSAVWVDQSSITSGTVDYSPMTKRVIWRPETVGKTGGNYRASFAVSVLPSMSDVGKTLPLINNIRLTGRDVHTNNRVNLTSPIITTAIEADSRATGNGVVEILE